MAKTYRVALYFNMTLVHHQGMVDGIMRYARDRTNWRLFGTYWPLYQLGDIGSWRGDGIIAAVESEEDIRLLTKSGLPVVDTSGAILHDKLSLVTNDNVAIGRVGGEHLRGIGFDHFAFCAADKSNWSEERLRGFAEASGAGAAVAVFRKRLSWWHSPEFSRELAEFLLRQKRPLAVMAANDIIGMNVVGACRMAGLEIPKDVAIVGVDNEEMLCELATPPMTSIPFDRRAIGLQAAERLDSLMRGAALMPSQRIPPLPLVERASTATFALSDSLVVDALTIIRKHATDFLTAGEVASRLFTSRRNLERRFRQQVGRTILEEIHRARVNHAKRLLRESDLPVMKVAALSGFRTGDRFTAVFTKYAGQAPRSYRAEKGLGR